MSQSSDESTPTDTPSGNRPPSAAATTGEPVDASAEPTALQISKSGAPATRPEPSEHRTQVEAPEEDTVLNPTPQSEPTRQAESLDEKIRKRIAAHDSEGPAADELLGVEVGGRFTIVSKVGEGGMGIVYKARQRAMDRDVAVKVLLKTMTANESVVRRFHLEALAVSKLRHPNTIQIYDFGETPAGQLYIAMEFLDGRSLQELVRKEGTLAPKRALSIASQMAKSLREAHNKGIVHRDLKPDNIFLTTVGEEADFVKVLDFGVAKLREQDKSQATLTKAGAIVGTPRYMSPEQSTSATNVDHRSDLYSIGVMLFEMLTGRAPFSADSPLGVLIKHVQQAPPSFSKVRPDLVFPSEVERLTRRLLAKKAEDRPQTAEALIREIEKVDRDLDDVFRKVVTSDYAERLGLDTQVCVHTEFDTRMGSRADQAVPTIGPYDDETLARRETVREPRWGRRLAYALAALVIVADADAGVVYGALDTLPAGYTESNALKEITIGEVPALVLVGVESNPSGLEVKVGDTTWKTPFALQRTQNAAPEQYTVAAVGYVPRSGKIGFDSSQDLTLTLEAIAQPTVVKPVDPGASTTEPVATDPTGKEPGSTDVRKPDTKPGKKPGGKKPGKKPGDNTPGKKPGDKKPVNKPDKEPWKKPGGAKAWGK